jgi:hypothetical protein
MVAQDLLWYMKFDVFMALKVFIVEFGLRCCGVVWVLTSVLEEPVSCIFRVKYGMKESSKALVTTYRTRLLGVITQKITVYTYYLIYIALGLLLSTLIALC